MSNHFSVARVVLLIILCLEIIICNHPPIIRIICKITIVYLFILFIEVYCSFAAFDYEIPTRHLLTDINIHSDTQAEPRKLSSLTLYINLWQEVKPASGQNPPVISPPVATFHRIGVRAEIRT
jgi:hypothetical protein